MGGGDYVLLRLISAAKRYTSLSILNETKIVQQNSRLDMNLIVHGLCVYPISTEIIIIHATTRLYRWCMRHAVKLCEKKAHTSSDIAYEIPLGKM